MPWRYSCELNCLATSGSETFLRRNGPVTSRGGVPIPRDDAFDVGRMKLQQAYVYVVRQSLCTQKSLAYWLARYIACTLALSSKV